MRVDQDRSAAGQPRARRPLLEMKLMLAARCGPIQMPADEMDQFWDDMSSAWVTISACFSGAANGPLAQRTGRRQHGHQRCEDVIDNGTASVFNALKSLSAPRWPCEMMIHR